MKPAFTLDFRNDAIALLHRTTAGWHPVGRVTFDDPDMPAALSYLRATALGLSPRGLSTKLVLPEDQVLYTTVDAPGPDDASRAAQIRTALEGRTPYAVEDLVFDWEIDSGEVRVAVIPRETLAEAEAFATEHRFNPVAFAAPPANGFAAEPWFGLSALAPSLLAAGETVERDGEVSTQDMAQVPSEPEIVPEPKIIPEPEVEPEPESEIEPEPEPEIEPEAVPEFEPAPEPEIEPASAQETDLAVESMVEPIANADLQPLNRFETAADAPAPTTAADLDFASDVPADFDLPDLPFIPAAPPEPRQAPIFGLADDEPTPSQVFGSAPGPTRYDDDLPADLIAALQDTNLQDIVLEEAPMAVDVEDQDGDAEEIRSDDGLHPAASAGTSNVTDLSLPDLSLPDDVPPVPGYSPAIGFASRRASVDEGRSQKVAPPALRPAIARPTAAKPLAPVAPKAERPMVSRPTAAKPVVAKESKGLRGFGAFVSAPSLPGSGKKRAMIAAQPATSAAPAASAAPATPATTTASSASAGTKSLERGLGARPAPVRGKPRYLGLALTMILLLILAVIAAWSTSLAFRTNDAAETQLAATDTTPAPDEEMLADGIDPEAEADDTAAEPAVEDTALTEAALPADPAPEGLAASQETAPAPAANPGASSGDEIFLAAKDPSPIAPEPLDLPEISAQGDPLPNAQAPPPPFGTVYQFDANGLIVPTPEGIVTPEGVLLLAGKPPVVPKARPEGLAPDVATLNAPADAETVVAAGAAFPSDPALEKYRPKARPAGLVAPATDPAAAPDDATLAPDTTIPGPESRLASLRPMARPQAVLAAGDAARAASGAAAASLAAQAEAKAAAEAAAAPTSKLAVAISRKPQPRPRDLSRAVEAAVAAAVRAPEPKPEPETETQAKSVAPTPKPKPKAEPEPTVVASAAPTKSKGRDADPEADDEPELASVPVGKSQGSVAKQATFKNALNLSKTALIGVYGTPSNRYAMIRTEAGRYKKVKVGDKIDGGKIQAITASEVRYQKGSKLVTLGMPKS